MYPLTPTETEKINKKIADDAPKIEDAIKKYIEEHQALIPQMREGVNYYFNKGKITKRTIDVYDESGNKSPDPDATNNKIPSGWHKLLVDQKVSYLVGDPVTIASKTEKDIKLIQEVLGEEFEDTLPELVKNASNKGRDWLHPYIDEEGKFDYIIIPAEEFIPIYDDNKRKHLKSGIRFYAIDEDVTKIELWEENIVTYYEMIKEDVYLDVTEEINPASHFYYGEKGYGWGKVPFVEFANNEERVSDLTFYKAYIDVYDLLMSDVSNTLEDIQSLIYALKGYEGTNGAEFMNDLKRFKVILLSDEPGSGVETIRADVPVDATEAHLNRLAKDIYAWGQGVDVANDKLGNAPSGISLKFLFSLLDMKASVMERKFNKGLEKFMWFVCEYLSISGQGTFDYKDIIYTYNKSILVNEAELLDNLTKSQSSLETKLENDPFVKDVQIELDRLKKEQDEYARFLPEIGGSSTPSNKKPKSSESGSSGGEETCPECGGDGKVSSDVTGKQIQCKTCGGDGVIG